MLTPIQGTFLNYSKPTCTIALQEGEYKVLVSVNSDTNTSENILEQRLKVLDEEISKNSLLALAFIQKLAIDGDKQAKDITAIYQAYHSFFNTGNKEPILQLSERISKDASTDPFAQKISQYVVALLSRQCLDEPLASARSFINNLMPGFEQSMTMDLPHKAYQEQKITFAGESSPHKAFPDIIKYNGDYYVAFREADTHVGHQDFGQVRVLKGKMNPQTHVWTWENIALLSKEGYDLRDPRFFINGKNVLEMIMGGSKINEKHETESMEPQVAKYEQGKWVIENAEVDPTANGPKGQWIWRVTWNPYDNKGYALSYGKGSSLTLVKTSDGQKYEKVTDISLSPLTDFSEGTLRFKSDGTAVAFIRTQKNGIIGTAKPEDGYQKWTLTTLPYRVGGPNFIISKTDQKMWAATRYFFLNENNTLDLATVIAAMNENSIVPLLRLKSQGDNSYPGMFLEDDGSATVVYYSSESEDKSNIYITRVMFPLRL